MVAKTIRFSVIVVTYNNWNAISRVLPALLSETRGREDCEVIVVDSSIDGSTKNIETVFSGVRLIHPPSRVLPGPARNLGAENGKGDVLIFLDGDCIPSPGWLNAMASQVQKLEANIVCGSVDLLMPSDLSQFMEYVFWKLSENSSVKRGQYRFVITENMMIRRDRFTATGGFGDSDSANDAQMDAARRRAGLGIHFEPSAKVSHLHPSGWWFHVRKLYRVGQEVFTLMRELKDYPVGRYMTYTFPVVFLIRWLRITWRVLRYRPYWLGRYVLVQPLLWAGLLAFQAGLWCGLFDLVCAQRNKGIAEPT